MHHKPLLIALLLMTSPAAAELTFATTATQIGQRVDAPARYAFPIAAFDGATVPTRIAEGALDQRAYRLDGSRANTLALLQPLRAQLESAGYRVIFDCATTDCGGYDFRFAMQVLPEPQMHIDLGDFRYLVAETAKGDMISLTISRAGGQGFVQVTSVTRPAMPVSELGEPQTALTPPAPELPNPNPELAPELPAQPEPPAPPAPPAPQPDSGSLADQIDPGNLADQIDRTGAAALDDLIFASGKAALATGDYASLAALADWLKAHPDLRVTLVGHTDATGSLASNTALSRQRALSVRDRLIQNFGTDATQLDAQGAGYLAPRATNQTAEGRQKNRRVEVMLTSTSVK